MKYSKRNSMSVLLGALGPQDAEFLVSFSSSIKHIAPWQQRCEAILKGFMCEANEIQYIRR